MNPFANGITPELLLGMLRRHVWIAAFLFSLTFTAIVGVVAFLPNIYSASAFILVEGQQIPQQFVQSTVTMGVERRIQMISQEILSRARLAQLIKQFDLYEDLRKDDASEDVLAAAMRKDIAINIKGKGSQGETVAFEVSFTNPDPQKVMQVANTLASFYIEENLKVREQQALGTTEFLRSELSGVKKRLDAQEQQVAEYKQKYMGELPEQIQANLSQLTVLQKQIEVYAASLIQAQERRAALLRHQDEAKAAPPTTANGASEANPALMNLEQLRQLLAQLEVRFKDKHPDVIRLKQRISMLEERQNTQASSSAASAGPASAGTSFSSPVLSELTMVEAEIRNLTLQLEKARNDITLYQQRIENTPKREQEMLSIRRDYEATRDLYASLLKRLDEANLADSLEQRQKAERFRILEPAVYPQEPAGPKRQRLFLLGLALSLGVAAAGVLLPEVLDTSFRRVEDLSAFIPLRILGTIPQIVTEEDHRHALRRRLGGGVALVAGVIAVFGVSYWIGAGNEKLVRTLVRPASSVQLR